MANEKDKAPAASGGGPSQSAAADTTQQQLDESRPARQAADEKVGQGRVPLGTEAGGEVGTSERPLAGVLPAGVAQAGGPEAHARLVASDPHAYASMPGQQGVEAVGSGSLVPEDAQQAMQERAAAGIPEPPKVGPVPNVTLLDTPGGYQVIPGTVASPDELAQQQASVRPQASNLPRPPYGEEAGADNQVVAGPGSE
jgi:hypothetical protein